jgi:hypothetical protein
VFWRNLSVREAHVAVAAALAAPPTFPQRASKVGVANEESSPPQVPSASVLRWSSSMSSG